MNSTLLLAPLDLETYLHLCALTHNELYQISKTVHLTNISITFL